MWFCGRTAAVPVKQGRGQHAPAPPSAANDEDRTPTEYPSTGGLQILMQKEFLRPVFRSFVQTTWTPAFSPDTSDAFRNNARTWALNCIDFLADVRDFNLMHHNSVFQSYRGAHIFEKYIMHGAVLQVSLGSKSTY